MRDVAVPRRWPNATIVIAASGPSLSTSDLARVRNVAPLIAVNDAIRLAPWADVLYSSDRRWWAEYVGVPTFHGPKYGIGARVGDASPMVGDWAADVQILKNTGDTGLEFDAAGLRTGRHSGYAAINLAVHLGAKRIVLLGYDGGPSGGRDHFFGAHPKGLPTSSTALYDTFRRAYLTMVAPLAEAAIDIVNATPNTKITAFPRASIIDALAGLGVRC